MLLISIFKPGFAEFFNLLRPSFTIILFSSVSGIRSATVEMATRSRIEFK